MILFFFALQFFAFASLPAPLCQRHLPQLLASQPLPFLSSFEKETTDHLAELLSHAEVAEQIGWGAMFHVFRIKDVPGVVVKRMRAAEELEAQGELTIEQYFERMRAEHETCLQYFQNEYIPKTRFVIVKGNLGAPNAAHFQKGREYVMLQNEIHGVDCEPILSGRESSPKMTERLRRNLLEFIHRYEKMQKEELAVPENQIYYDAHSQRIWLSDTNHLIRLRSFIEKNEFLALRKLLPHTIRSGEDIAKTLLSTVPELEPYRDKSFELLRKDLYPHSPLCNKIFSRLLLEEKTMSAMGFLNLVAGLDYFPPSGDNAFIRKIKTRFNLF